MKEYICHYASPIGALTIASDAESVTGLWFDGQKYDRRTLSPDAEDTGDGSGLLVLKKAGEWLDRYFAGENPEPELPLRPQGTPFQQEVWELLRQIPYGRTATYGALAQKISRAHGNARAYAQAAGNAVGRNPISIFIPCHRVLGADGGLTGYAGGIERKRFLLRLEHIL